jgi:hypothetical protein
MPKLGLLLAGFALTVALAAQPLTRRNLEAPFCYAPGAERSWPVLSGELHRGAKVSLAALQGGKVVAESRGRSLRWGDLRTGFGRDGKLRVRSNNPAEKAWFDLRISVQSGGVTVQSQTVQLRAASPNRPIAYYADFGDDLINIFGLGFGGARPPLHHQLREGGAPVGTPATRTAGALPVFDKEGFDQYFRRLQCQGVAREILWLSPFSLVTDASAYEPSDWSEFVERANAIVRSPEIAAIQMKAEKFSSWGWVRDLMVFRLDRRMHQALSDSAIAHGISLSLSYRPLEQAVSKYYEIPVFDSQGTFLDMYQPLASPAVNAHPDRVGFAHYREVLRQMGRGEEAEPTEIELECAGDPGEFLAAVHAKGHNLRLLAARYAPIQPDSFVLVRQPGGAYDLVPWRAIQAKAERRRQPITGFTVERGSGNTVRLTGTRIPPDASFLLIDSPGEGSPLNLDNRHPARLRNRAGLPLGRNVTYFSYPDQLTDELKKTQTGGITADGEFNPVFFAAEAAANQAYKAAAGQDLRRAVLVIDRGERYATEMVDFTLPQARAGAIREILAVFKYPAFRSLYINSRSHTQLAGDSRDGDDGVQPLAHYNPPRRGSHLGLDLAYAPRYAGRDEALAAAPLSAIANHSHGEWLGQCQTAASCGHPWRLARNRFVAEGIRNLVLELARALPNQPPLQVVLPESETVSREMSRFPAAGMVPHTAGRYNYIQNIGEGMAMLDLAGSDAAPVLLGAGAFVSPAVLDRFLDTALKDLSGNRASQYQGPKSIMYEGQYALTDEKGRAAREAAMCTMLSRPAELAEVVLYEAADWTYRLPWDGFDFLDRCAPPASRHRRK